LNGKRIALINQSKYHAPGGCIGNAIVEKDKINATIVYVPPKELVKAVKDGRADATIVWLDAVKGDVKDDVKVIPVEKYEMQLYIIVVNKNKVVEEYVNYLLSHKEEFVKYGWR